MFVLDTYKRLPVTFVKGEGIYLYDTNGKRYVDLISGIGVSVLGYGDAGMVKIIKKRAEELLHISNLFENPWQDKLAEKLIKHFGSKGKVFFCNSGTEANEAGIKFLRKYWYKQGSKRYRIITFKGGFHGRTYGSLSATAQERFHKGFEPLLDGFDYAEFNNFDSVVKSLRDDTGGIMLEIIQGEGGINEADGDFLLKIQDLCKREGLLLFIDEVQTGTGRTGKFFAYQHFGLEPDIVTLAKGLGGGVPIGATIVSERVAETVERGDHGSTFGGNPLACEVALYVISKVEQLMDHISTMGGYLKGGLSEVGRIKGRGLMLGIELGERCSEVLLKLLERGIVANCTGNGVLRLLPPYIIDEGTAEFVIRNMKEII